MRYHTAIAFMLALLVTPLCLSTMNQAGAAEARFEVETHDDVVYGTGAGEDLKLDLALPKGVETPRPALVFIHGGGWAAGNKRMFRPLIKQAAERGFVAASVGYRLAPKHRFPAQVEDCKCAVRWLRAHADEFNVNPDQIGASGASAGAHLAMMLGTMDSQDGMEGSGGWQDQSSKVQVVVSYFGPTDMTSTSVEGLAGGEYVQEAAVRRIIENFIGGPVDDNADTLRLASPVTYVNEGDAPMLLFQGTRDPLVPFDQAFSMATALTKAGIKGRVELILQANHGWFGDEMTRTVDGTFDFFGQHLGAAQADAKVGAAGQ
jgi:acetyl esterase/lipase